MTRYNPLSKDPDEIERMWYVPPSRTYKPGWLLYSEDFVIEALQGKIFDTDTIVRTSGYRFAAAMIRAGMAVGQALIMLLSYLPILQRLTGKSNSRDRCF